MLREGLPGEVVLDQRPPPPQIRKQEVRIGEGRKCHLGRESCAREDLQAGLCFIAEQHRGLLSRARSVLAHSLLPTPATVTPTGCNSSLVPQSVDLSTFYQPLLPLRSCFLRSSAWSLYNHSLTHPQSLSLSFPFTLVFWQKPNFTSWLNPTFLWFPGPPHLFCQSRSAKLEAN